MLNQLDCHIHLTATQIEAWYRGQVKQVIAQSTDGRRIQLPIHHLQPYFEHLGVHGLFRLVFTDAGEMVSLNRLDSKDSHIP